LFLFSTTITVITLSKAYTPRYESLSWMQKQEYLVNLTSILHKIHTWVNNIWVYGELFVLLFNKRKRAIHNYTANTVIVKTEYLEKIREVMNADEKDNNQPKY
jgi:hypothetical protein